MSEQMQGQKRGSLIVLGALVIVLSFIAGYYWSRYTLAEDFLQLCFHEELSDKVAAAFYAREGDQVAVEAEEREQENLQSEPEVENDRADTRDTMHEKREDEVVTLQAGQELTPQAASVLESRRLYQAILIGFGEKRSAERYIAKLASSGIEAHVVKRTGKNRRGREVTWYQVVTTAMTYDDITNVIMQLKKTDRLEGVMIVEAETAAH
jgi:hypothetical protein